MKNKIYCRHCDKPVDSVDVLLNPYRLVCKCHGKVHTLHFSIETINELLERFGGIYIFFLEDEKDNVVDLR